MTRLLMIFIGVPFLELLVLLQVSARVGLLWTIVLVIVTGMVGAVLVRAAGLECLGRARRSFAEGIFPADELFDGLCIAVAGALLITPGLLTDLAGFAMLVPQVRRALRTRLRRWAEQRSQPSVITISSRRDPEKH